MGNDYYVCHPAIVKVIFFKNFVHRSQYSYGDILFLRFGLEPSWIDLRMCCRGIVLYCFPSAVCL